jgi:hypothetical protein
LIDLYVRPVGTQRAVAGLVRTLQRDPIEGADIRKAGSILATANEYGFFYTTAFADTDTSFILEAAASGYINREEPVDLSLQQIVPVDFVMEPTP